MSTPLRLAQSDDSEAEPARTPSERRADALADVCRSSSTTSTTAPPVATRPNLNVVVDYEDLAAGSSGRAVDGAVLHGTAVSALACDSALPVAQRCSTTAPRPRTILATLCNALVVRDEHCRFPGCDRQSSWCEGHHVVHLADDGPTCLRTWCWCAPAATTDSTTGVAGQAPPRCHPGGHRPGGCHWSTAPPGAGPALA